MNTSKLWLYRLITSWRPETRCFGLKASFLRWCGARVGNNVRINSSAIIMGDGSLEIGDDVWIGAGCRISPVGGATIKIGSCCDLGPEVMILTGSHLIDPQGSHIGGDGISCSVTIGAGSWLWARSTILPGVALPARTIVAAGAVVTRSIDGEKSLVAGVPAEIRKTYS